MGAVIKFIPKGTGPKIRGGGKTSGPLRRPDVPASQCVRLGDVVSNLLEELRVHGRLTGT